VLALSYVSNVTGVVNPVAELCALARSLGALTVVDASQAVAHLPIDVEALGADFLAFSGHKMFGPFGTGVLWGRREALEALDPLTMGGGAVERVTESEYTPAGLPERLEAGTPNVTGVIGLAAAVNYIDQFSWTDIAAHDAVLADCLEQELSATAGIRTLMAGPPARVPIGSFSVELPGLPAEQLAALLSDTENIMVRVGKQCAHPLFARERLTSAVRVSLSIYNTAEEVRHLGEALRRIVRRFGR
jgi:cysteine desulfurase/selenocysteine lyase